MRDCDHNHVRICNRCGKCCWYTKGNKLTKCKYLVKLNHNIWHCMIYENRVGTVISIIDGKSIICGPRIDKKEIYPNCPYNELI